MKAPRKRRDPELLLELGRDWRGRLRRLRSRHAALPLWARLGLSAPRLEWTLTLVACGCALAGGALIAIVFAPNGAR